MSNESPAHICRPGIAVVLFALANFHSRLKLWLQGRFPEVRGAPGVPDLGVPSHLPVAWPFEDENAGR